MTRSCRLGHPVPLVAAVLAVVLALLLLGAPPASAAAATLTKTLDSIQGGGFTSPNTFETGATVRYRLRFQCSSLTDPCGTGQLADVLDPNLEFVQVVPPSSADVSVTSVFDVSSRTVTIDIDSFDDGDSAEVVIVARVRGTTPGGTTIPNTATITVPGGTPTTTAPVATLVPAPTPPGSWERSS